VFEDLTDSGPVSAWKYITRRRFTSVTFRT